MRLGSLMGKQRIAFFKMQQSQRPKLGFFPSFPCLPPLFCTSSFPSCFPHLLFTAHTQTHTSHISIQLQFQHMLRYSVSGTEFSVLSTDLRLQIAIITVWHSYLWWDVLTFNLQVFSRMSLNIAIIFKLEFQETPRIQKVSANLLLFNNLCYYHQLLTFVC